MATALKFRRLIPVFAFFLMAFSCRADEIDDNMLAEAQKCSDATVAKDWEKVAGYMPASVAASVGGKDNLLKAIQQTGVVMAQKGLKITKAVIGKSVQRKEIKGAIYAVISQTVTAEIPEGVLVQKSYLLGISADTGKSWAFMDAAQLDANSIKALFPDAAGEITIPAKEKPLFQKK